jgi:hypothetical protein
LASTDFAAVLTQPRLATIVMATLLLAPLVTPAGSPDPANP